MPIVKQTASGGGPVIAIPAELAPLWRGVLAPLEVTPPPSWSWGDACDFLCDYDRICEPDLYTSPTDYGGLGFIQVGDGQALALDCEILTEAVLRDDGCFIVRNPVDELPTERILAAASGQGFRPVGELSLQDGRLFIFDSAFEGYANPEAIEADDGVVVIAPGPGRYQVLLSSPEGRDVIQLRRQR